VIASAPALMKAVMGAAHEIRPFDQRPAPTIPAGGRGHRCGFNSRPMPPSRMRGVAIADPFAKDQWSTVGGRAGCLRCQDKRAASSPGVPG